MLMENITTLKRRLLQKFSHHLPVSYAFSHILVMFSKRKALRHQNVGDFSMSIDVQTPIHFLFIMPEN